MNILDKIDYNTTINSERCINYSDFNDVLNDIFCSNDIVTIWEEHNHNKDNSFKEVEKYADIIFYLYRRIKEGNSFEKVIKEISNLYSDENNIIIRKFKEFLISFYTDEDIMYQSSSRIFAKDIIPLASKNWFNDLVFEWFSEDDPRKIYELSSDKIGFLLTIISSLINWIQIHWAYSHNIFIGFLEIAWKFEDKIKDIKLKNTNAKILTYNWGFHNMTIPFQWTTRVMWKNYNCSNLTFAPNLKRKYWDKYLSIDIVDSRSQTEKEIHFAELKKRALKWKINIINHSDNQIAFVLPKKNVNVFWNVNKILANK